MKKRKKQSGFASFSMQGLAEAICGIDRTTNTEKNDQTRVGVDEPIKPKQNELHNTRTSREVR